MCEASKAVNGGAGILHIVKNYTGDIMNFELAAENAEIRRHPDRNRFWTDDDVAVEKQPVHGWPPRRWSSPFLMEKLLGAAAEQRMSLSQIKILGEQIRNTGRSMGMALTPCTVPHAGKPSFELPDDEIELGIGIHGEPGRRRVKFASADEITEMLMDSHHHRPAVQEG